MPLPDLTGQYIQDTYQRVLQVSGSGDIVDGTGALFIPPNAISASYATSASHEIIKEISSSHANFADTASFAQSGDGIFSGSFSGSYVGDGSNLTGISAGPFTQVGSTSTYQATDSKDLQITGSLIISGSLQAFQLDTTNVILGKDPGTPTGTNQNNVLIGNQVAGGGLGSGAYNVVAMGFKAAYNVGSKDDFIALGFKAGYNAYCDKGVWIGYESGLTGGAGGVCIGYQAGRGASGTNSTYNTFIGYQSGYSIDDSDFNTGLGYQSLYSLNDATYNIGIGYKAGYNITDGGSNIIIGSGSLGEAALSNQLRIGNGEAITTISASLITGDITFPAAVNVGGTQRSLFTSCSLAYSGSNVTQVTQSFESGNTQITNILYSGSFADGNPLSVAVTGSDGVNKLYTMTYSASLVTQILVT